MPCGIIVMALEGDAGKKVIVFMGSMEMCCFGSLENCLAIGVSSFVVFMFTRWWLRPGTILVQPEVSA